MSPRARYPPRSSSLETHSSNVQLVQLAQEPMSNVNVNANTDQEKYKEFINCEYPAAEGGLS